MKNVNGNGCEYVKCSDWTGTSCAYDGPICKYREEAELLASKDQTIADLRAELDLYRADMDLTLKTHVYVNDEWHKALKRLEAAERDLARYREGFGPVITLLKDGFDPGSMLVREKIREAIKAVEGEDSPKVTESVTKGE